MSQFRKLSQTIWFCQYHIVWVAKYRFRVLTGQIAEEVENCIRAFSEQQGCEVVELNVQADYVHLLALVPPKVSISGYVGTLKGRTAIRVFNRFRKLKEKYGNLTPNDLRLCSYLRMNFTTKEMAHLLNISPRAVEIGRYRLRQKLKLDHVVNLTEFLIRETE